MTDYGRKDPISLQLPRYPAGRRGAAILDRLGHSACHIATFRRMVMMCSHQALVTNLFCDRDRVDHVSRKSMRIPNPRIGTRRFYPIHADLGSIEPGLLFRRKSSERTSSPWTVLRVESTELTGAAWGNRRFFSSSI